MLLFSTILKIDKSLAKDDFLNLVIEWNQGSPHENNVIPNLNWDGSYNQKFGDETISLEFKEYRNEEIIAVRYVKKLDDGIIWKTDYIMNFRDYKMSIMLDRSFTEDAIGVDPSFTTPLFIKLLIEKGYVVNDNDLPVVMDPHMIDCENLNVLTAVINETKTYDLPIVYVSKTFSNNIPIDVDKLAYALKGVAHIFVQSDLRTNTLIREQCDNANEYNGAIGIYYQSDLMKHKRFLNYEYFDPTITRQNIVKDIINFTNQQSIDPLYTWDGVTTFLLKDRFKSQKDKRTKAETTKEETDELLESFSSDFDALTEENSRLRDNISDLENELAFYKDAFNKKTVNDSGFLSNGSEKEFFQDEKKELILSVLSDSLASIKEDTRRKHIVQDIIQQNTIKDVLGKKREEVKRLLTDYSGLNGKLKQELQQLGFAITEDGKHYKLTYFNDKRYIIHMAKTPSDGRAGKNNVSNINNKVF
ncbi:hypothetical protein DW726_01300 [Streptococcus gordonii]|uniref:hypothetical protein n=1 Tax=Streptococcus gordonii TaxID=1302 RepID=UPI000E467D0E|nr:hypothetical protein [Streptococcus gordonii]RHE65896.1 hypothetical protein DW726_01300 [Streptococcus gordonii]